MLFSKKLETNLTRARVPHGLIQNEGVMH